MKTENRKQEYCECCGLDFTHRSYSEKIHHLNYCNENSMMARIVRFNECNTEEKKLRWLTNSVGININYEDIDIISYNSTMEIFNCLIKMYSSGIYNHEINKIESFPDVVEYMLSRKAEIKKHYNKLLQKKINKINNDYNSELKHLKSLLQN